MKVEYFIEGTYHDLKGYPDHLHSIVAVLLSNEELLSDGYGYYGHSTAKTLEKMANAIYEIVADGEREACARLLATPQTGWNYALQIDPDTYHLVSDVLNRAAAAIRARGGE